MLLDSFCSIGYSLFDEFELEGGEVLYVLIAHVFLNENLSEISQVGVANALSESAEFLSSHFRHCHAQDLEILIEGRTDVRRDWPIDDALSLAHFDFDGGIRDHCARHLDSVEVETASTVGRWYRRIEVDDVSDAGLANNRGDIRGIDLCCGGSCRVVSTSPLKRRMP
jgi:hypothetical protein